MKRAFKSLVMAALILISAKASAAEPAVSADTPRISAWDLTLSRIQEREFKAACPNADSGSLSEASCVKFLASKGQGTCSDYKDAKESILKFHETCEQTGYDAKSCIQSAAACANQFEGEEGDLAEVNRINRELGIPQEESSEELANKCTKYNLKDYETRRNDLAKELREAQKDLETAQKDVAKAAEEYSKEKRRQVERQSKIQEQISKLVDSNQKDAQERAQQMGKDLMDLEKEQTAVKVQNLQAQGEIAKLQGQRASQLARLTDAMISTNCMEKVDLLLKKWALEGPKTLNGSAALFRSNTEKKRRIQDEHRACLEEGNAARKAARKTFQVSIQAVKDQIKGNDAQVARIDEQKNRQQTDYQAFLSRQKMSETEAYNRAQAELQALNMEKLETEQVRNQRSQEAALAIEENRKRVNEATNAMANMGSKPRGEKKPSDAISHLRKFMSIYRSFESNECKALMPELKKIAKDEVVSAYVSDYEKTRTTTPTNGSPGSATRATPGSK